MQHQNDVVACLRVVEIFLKTGSHCVTPYGLGGAWTGTVQAWLIVEVDSKEDARRILPPAFRREARIVGLNKFTMEQVEELLLHHQSQKKAG